MGSAVTWLKSVGVVGVGVKMGVTTGFQTVSDRTIAPMRAAALITANLTGIQPCVLHLFYGLWGIIKYLFFSDIRMTL